MQKIAFEQIYVPDATALMEECVSKLIEQNKIKGKIHILKDIIEDLENKARNNSSLALAGIEEIKRLINISDSDVYVEIVTYEPRTRGRDVDLEKLVRNYTYEIGGILITTDELQAQLSKILGVEVIYVRKEKRRPSFEKYFDNETMSIHLKEGTYPRAKKGSPEYWYFEIIEDRKLDKKDLERMIMEIFESLNMSNGEGFIEANRSGSSIIQLGRYRIVIVKPPLSDGIEITITRHLAKPDLESYNLPDKLLKRLAERAEGILIAGSPGMGKTTFAQALAEYYMRMGKVVKTIESPRDMHLPNEISQYSKVHADENELHDILLLSRPDYTFFDEMRTDTDFKIYIDLRLAGIGMVGVVHATSPIDAIQRMLRRVDLGMIPSIIDTVIYINKGKVDTVYEVNMTVKLPTGLKEADLARPVVEVRNFLTGELEYEIYTFGEQTVVIPIRKQKKQTYENSMQARIAKEIEKLLPGSDVIFEGDTVWIKIPRENAVRSSRKFMKLKKRLEKQYGVVVKLKLG